MHESAQVTPLTVVINQVDNGFIVYEHSEYRIGQRVFMKELIRCRQWIAKDALELSRIIDQLAREASVLFAQKN